MADPMPGRVLPDDGGNERAVERARVLEANDARIKGVVVLEQRLALRHRLRYWRGVGVAATVWRRPGAVAGRGYHVVAATIAAGGKIVRRRARRSARDEHERPQERA